MNDSKIKRCTWVPADDRLYTEYHDREWGVPLHDDRKIFQFLILEGFQAGLSWRTVLYKRENFKAALDRFDPEKIAGYQQKKINRLLDDAGIIRNQLKIRAAVTNARAFLKVKDEFGSFDDYIWRFVDGRPIKNHWRRVSDIPARTDVSDRLSRDLQNRGFKFVGSTICYAHMQATGMVNDHLVGCFRYNEV